MEGVVVGKTGGLGEGIDAVVDTTVGAIVGRDAEGPFVD